MTPRIFVLAAAVVFASCDTQPVADTELAHSELIQVARVWYDATLKEQQAEKEEEDSGKTADGGYDLSKLVERYAPDWSTAVVLSRKGGGHLVAALLEDADASFDRRLSVVRTIVHTVDAKNSVESASLVEFFSLDALKSSDLSDHVRQWEAQDFKELSMGVAEYSIGYVGNHAHVYVPDHDPIPVSLSIKETGSIGPGKVMDSPICYIAEIKVYADICMGPLSGNPETTCDEYTDYEITCSDGNGGTGGGGGHNGNGGVGGGGGSWVPGDGGDDDSDDEEEEECGDEDDEEECEEEEDEEEDCPDECNQYQCDLAEEYDDETSWSCTTFSTSYGEFILQDSDTENGLHSGYGFIDSRLPSGFSLIEQHFNASFRINSGYRCPKGNGVTPGAGTLSKHMLGLAVDFQELGWPAGTTERKRQIKEWTEDPNGAGAGFVQFYSDKTHMHADWR